MVKVCPQAMCVAVIANNRKVRSGKVFFMVGGFFRNRGASNTFFATWQTVFSAKDKIFSLDNNKGAALRQLFYSV